MHGNSKLLAKIKLKRWGLDSYIISQFSGLLMIYKHFGRVMNIVITSHYYHNLEENTKYENLINNLVNKNVF